MLRVLLVTHGTDGDVLPFIRLGQELAGRGHEVTLLGPEPYAPAAGEQLRYVAATSAGAYQRELLDSQRLLAGPGRTDPAEFYRRHRMVDTLRREVATLRAAADRHTILVGRHSTGLAAPIAAEAAGVPAVWLAVAPVQYFTGHLALASFQSVLRDEVAQVRAELGLAPVPDWTPWFTGEAGPGVHHFGLWPDWFDRAGVPAPSAVTLTGFVPPDTVAPPDAVEQLPEPVRALLAHQPAPVLVTGGTGRFLHERFYRAAIGGARELGRPVLVVTRHRDLVPDVDAADVCWQPWLPFGAVFPRVAAVVHHGGIGTAVRAVACAAPQLLLAHAFDRPDNGGRLARLGLGSWLPAHEWSPATVAGALAGMLAAGPPPEVPGLDRNRLDGAAVVAGAIEQLVGAAPPAGDSSPAQSTTADRIRALSPQRRAALARLRAARPLERH